MTQENVKASSGTTSMTTVVAASSTGTAFEWYDFFVYGALASVIARNFFTQLNPTAGMIVTLAVFASAFLFRPFGALLFGWLGDRFGRKGTFLATVVLMGGATFAIGLLPTYDQAGGLGAFLLVVLRILQGMAVGGEYGGAAIYVAEHAKTNERGRATGWIQSSASLGLIGALVVVLILRSSLGEEAFLSWGWRVPFLLSALLVAVSIWMRLHLKESPEFVRMRTEGQLSRTPFADVFLKWRNLKYVLIAFFSLMLAQGAIWWCVFFYTQTFLESFMKLDSVWMYYVLIGATLLSIPLYVFFGWLSDRIGRKPVILFGIGLALIAMFPGFHGIARSANPALFSAQERSPIVVVSNPDTCSFQFDLFGQAKYETACDIARNILTRSGVNYTFEPAPGAAQTLIRVGDAELDVQGGVGLPPDQLSTLTSQSQAAVTAALTAAGYPQKAAVSEINWPMLVIAFGVLVIAATALYGPLAATMVELFPTNIRYTALSVPYHVGIGWVGGLMPMTAFAMSVQSGNIFAGLWYPVFFAGLGLVCCVFFFPETRGRPLDRMDT